jgi:hypothetical protein
MSAIDTMTHQELKAYTQGLLEAMHQIKQSVGSHLGEEVAATLSKTSKNKKASAKAEKPAVKREGGAHAAWSAKMTAEFALVKEAYTAARVAKAEAGTLLYEADSTAVKQGKHQVGEAYTVAGAKAGIHLVWAAEQKRERAAEYEAFVAAHAVAHPKSSAGSVADDASVADSAVEEAPKKGRKPMTEEAKAAAALKRAAKKATKEAAAPADAEPAATEDKAVEEDAVVLPEEEASAEEAEEPSYELVPFVFKKVSYMRAGYTDAEDNEVWHSDDDLWMPSAEEGVAGAYAGRIKGNVLDKSLCGTEAEPLFG